MSFLSAIFKVFLEVGKSFLTAKSGGDCRVNAERSYKRFLSHPFTDNSSFLGYHPNRIVPGSPMTGSEKL
jgi:hypothetical protein